MSWAGPAPTTTETVAPFFSPNPAAGSVLTTWPFCCGVDTPVVICGVSPASCSVRVACAWVCPTTLGTVTSSPSPPSSCTTPNVPAAITSSAAAMIPTQNHGLRSFLGGAVGGRPVTRVP